MSGTPSDEARIANLITSWARAATEHDLDAVLAHHSPDILMFDVPTVALHGMEAYKESWPPFFSYLGSSGKFELDDLKVTAGETTAFATAIARCLGEGHDELTVRLTVGLKKLDGQWTVVHEHHSVASP